MSNMNKTIPPSIKSDEFKEKSTPAGAGEYLALFILAGVALAVVMFGISIGAFEPSLKWAANAGFIIGAYSILVFLHIKDAREIKYHNYLATQPLEDLRVLSATDVDKPSMRAVKRFLKNLPTDVHGKPL